MWTLLKYVTELQKSCYFVLWKVDKVGQKFYNEKLILGVEQNSRKLNNQQVTKSSPEIDWKENRQEAHSEEDTETAPKIPNQLFNVQAAVTAPWSLMASRTSHR